ncbi:AorFlbE-like protein [Purpureocillium lavendulum]|uniref:AorFlbE-like protein n=1 Tax=Purpureocillium lavendulum TaxID=1247861 RepID=A0AB34FZJ3_9HYPO|nr:AorFlbE-like protein [Purpureocillium lavendulum]
MPTYLCHGFRWHRREIRIFVILNDIDDAAPDWIVGRTSSASLLAQFANNFDFLPKEPLAVPELVREPAGTPHRDDDLSVPPSRVAPSEDDVLANDWSPVKLLEEYDLEETQSASRPYAFVADHVVRIDLSVNVGDEMARYEAATAAAAAGATKDHAGGWFEQLRDKLQVGERIGWHIVVCADEERIAPDDGSSDYDGSDDDDGAVTPTRRLDLPMRPAADAPPSPNSRALAAAGAKPKPAAKGKERQQQGGAAQQPDFLRDDPVKTSPQPGLRHKLSTKGLRRLFSKKDGP